MFAEGTLVAGKYRLTRILGRGGMGVVAAATHVQLHQQVALKFLLPDLAANPHVVERFIREARASAALRSEHVCRVSDVGTMENGSPYLVMELLEGTDLARLITTQGPLSVECAAEYVLQACIGIAEAHHLGVVHRDLKPANLFLAQTPDGATVVKVLDFGIAKAQGADTGDFSLTKTSSVLGSPGYMSPEQLKSSRDVDHRSDIWSLGVILYELISRSKPFSAQSITELAIRVTMDPRAPLPVRAPAGFEQVIDACLAKDPRARFSDLAQLANALAPFAGPIGAEHARRVSRMLNVLPSVPMMPMVQAPAHEVAATVPPTAYGTPMMSMPVPMAMPTPPPSPPTTLGSSARSFETHASPSRRWMVIAGVALAIVGVAVSIVVATSGGKPVSPTTNTVTAPPPPITADAAPVAEPDAAAVATPPDLAPDAPESAPVDAAEPADAAATAPADAKKKIIKRGNQSPEDVSESRF